MTVLSPLAEEFFGGDSDVTAPGGNLFELVRELGKRAPGFAEVADVRAAFAVDGLVEADWSVPIGLEAEVTIFPRIGGGNSNAG